jgi:hypothetical protein
MTSNRKQSICPRGCLLLALLLVSIVQANCEVGEEEVHHDLEISHSTLTATESSLRCKDPTELKRMVGAPITKVAEKFVVSLPPDALEVWPVDTYEDWEVKQDFTGSGSMMGEDGIEYELRFEDGVLVEVRSSNPG